MTTSVLDETDVRRETAGDLRDDKIVTKRRAAGAQLTAARETQREMEAVHAEMTRVAKAIEDHFEAHGSRPPALQRQYDELCGQYRGLASASNREIQKANAILWETADPAVTSEIPRVQQEICKLDTEIMDELPKEKDRVEALKQLARVARDQFKRYSMGLSLNLGFDQQWPEWLGDSGARGAMLPGERVNLAGCEDRVARIERQAEIAERTYLERAERAPRERDELRSRIQQLESKVFDPLYVRLH